MEVKEMIVEAMASAGWNKDRIVDCFSKNFETFRGPARAAIWLSFDAGTQEFWLRSADFTSAGENVLAACYAFFPSQDLTYSYVDHKIKNLVAEMESKVATAFSVRIMNKETQ